MKAKILDSRDVLNPHTIEADSKRIKIVALGDSLTAGLQTQFDVQDPQMWNPYSRDLEVMTRRYLKTHKSDVDVQVINSGVCGDRTIDMLSRFNRDVVGQHPDYVIIWGGTNDIGWNLESTEILRNLREMYDIAESHKIGCVACTVPSILGFDDLIPPRLLLNELIRAEAEERSLPLIDLFAATTDPQTNRLLEEYSGDGLHLNVEGYTKSGQTVFNEWLKRLLDELLQ